MVLIRKGSDRILIHNTADGGKSSLRKSTSPQSTPPPPAKNRKEKWALVS